MLRILTFLVIFSEIEMHSTPHNRTVTLKFNDAVIHDSKNGMNEVNKGTKYSFVDQEDAKVTCNANNLTSKHWVLYLKEGENILKSYCSNDWKIYGEIVHNISLTTNMSGRHYKCELYIGSQLNRSKINNKSVCSVNEKDLEATTSIMLKVVFRVAKLNIFINKCKLEKNNMGTEVVYRYTNNEKLTAFCMHDDDDKVEWLPPAFYLLAAFEHKIGAALKPAITTGLTAKDNGSHFDCVEKNYLNNGTSKTNIQKRPTLRLRFILRDDEPKLNRSKDDEPKLDRSKDDEPKLDCSKENNKDVRCTKPSFKPEHWIFVAVGIICLLCLVIAIVKRDKIWKMRKSQKQVKVDPSLDYSKSDAPDGYTNILQPQPKLCETYTEPKPHNTINPDIYCEPYSALYLQPTPKRVGPKKESENHSDAYSNDPVLYSNEQKSNYVNLVNDYTTTNYMNVKRAKDNVYSDLTVYDVAV